MIPLFICEDDAIFRELLSKEIESYTMMQGYDMQLICKTDDPKILLEASSVHEGRGVYFLDIDLGINGFDGFDLAKILRKNDTHATIIFVTSHGELSMEAFKQRLEAMDYILKEDRGGLQERIRACIDSIQVRLLRHSAEKNAYYTVKVFDVVYSIPLKDILYFETAVKKHHICLHATHDILEFPGKLKNIENEVGKGFLRSHRSYLVNREHVKAIHTKSGLVELDNGETCLLSRSAKRDMKQ